MQTVETRDIFDKARAIAGAGLFAAGAAAIIGALLAWVTITFLPSVDPNTNFGTNAHVEAPQKVEPSGIESKEGKVVLVAGVVLLVAALLLVLSARSSYAWLAFLASIVMGSMAISAYRAIGDPTSGFSRRFKIVGDARPGLGVTLAAAAALVGLISAVVGIAGTPRRDVTN
jgi:O-antigen ligase